MQKRLYLLLAVLVVAAMVLAACPSQEATPTDVPATVVPRQGRADQSA